MKAPTMFMSLTGMKQYQAGETSGGLDQGQGCSGRRASKLNPGVGASRRGLLIASPSAACRCLGEPTDGRSGGEQYGRERPGERTLCDGCLRSGQNATVGARVYRPARTGGGAGAGGIRRDLGAVRVEYSAV